MFEHLAKYAESTEKKINFSKRKLVQGVGINDAPYRISKTQDNKTYTCPYFKVWAGMLGRCYSKALQKKQPTYKNCYVCNDWLTFSTFKNWMMTQDWKGKEIDKDILKPDNKIYSPDTCVFVDGAINRLLNRNIKKRGKYPQGVSYINDRGSHSYHASISRYGKQTKIGQFKTCVEAERAYKKEKYKYLLEVCKTISDIRVKNALKLHAKRYT